MSAKIGSSLVANHLTGLAERGDLLDGARTLAVFERLVGLPDKDVLVLLAVAIAEALAMGTALIDRLGQHLAVGVGADWQPDDLFFELVRDREAVGAMLTEVIGETGARS